MADSGGIALKGWGSFKKAIKPEHAGPIIEAHVGKALQLAGKILEAAQRKRIKTGMPPPNAPLTIAIKGSSKPLADRGDLFGANKSTAVAWNKVFVGVLATEGVYDIARTIHDGKVIPVTDKMRGLFTVLWMASIGSIEPSALTGRAAELWSRMPGGWHPLDENTKVIVIPARPWIKDTFEDPAIQKKVEKILNAAVKHAIKEIKDKAEGAT